MRPIHVVTASVVLTVLAGCSGNDTGTDEPAAPSAISTSTSSGGEGDQPYVPAPGDPETHELQVTIVDVGGVGGYEAGSDGCVAVATSRLVVEGPTEDSDRAPLEEVALPERADDLGGACRTDMTVTVPYAPRYTFGITREGRGVATGFEPDPVWVTTEGESQTVTVVSQVTTAVAP